MSGFFGYLHHLFSIEPLERLVEEIEGKKQKRIYMRPVITQEEFEKKMAKYRKTKEENRYGLFRD